MKTLVVLLLLCDATGASAHTKIQGLLTESEATPLGIDVTKLHFTWQMSSTRPDDWARFIKYMKKFL
ncbi:MAG TPA: hypothetical protein VEV84_13015 [Pyrinomonadaceae bacterium]|jgi:hypothetical protein|nr:hypothetical protein [Pyrinomonadaceae bacterium]